MKRPGIRDVRRAMRLANVNAFLWAVGNGLVSTLLVIYLAAELGASSFAISLILAAPRFAGVLRLAVPAVIARLQRRKEVCLVAFSLSSLVLCAVPIVAKAEQRLSSPAALAILVTAWCIYHLFEYAGTVALWSWLGDLTPSGVRGRLLGHREQWLVAGRLIGIVASALLALLWSRLLPEAARWQPLALSAAAGAGFMLLSVAPLWRMPATAQAPSASPAAPWRTLLTALADPAYRRLMTFTCCFSCVNGIPAAAQEMFPIRVLGVSYATLQALRGFMRAGQFAVAPRVGRLVDRFGNRPVMIVAQLLVATATLFYLPAAPGQWWWLVGAHLAWVAYAGLNVGLDNIKLKLAPQDNNAPYLAIYQASSDFVHGLTMVAGGALIDNRLRTGDSTAFALYTRLFLFAWIGRTLLVVLLARLIEPGARELKELVRRA